MKEVYVSRTAYNELQRGESEQRATSSSKTENTRELLDLLGIIHNGAPIWRVEHKTGQLWTNENRIVPTTKSKYVSQNRKRGRGVIYDHERAFVQERTDLRSRRVVTSTQVMKEIFFASTDQSLWRLSDPRHSRSGNTASCCRLRVIRFHRNTFNDHLTTPSIIQKILRNKSDQHVDTDTSCSLQIHFDRCVLQRIRAVLRADLW